MDLVDKAAPAPLPIEYDVALRKAQDLLLAQGVTAVADMGTSLDDWLALRRFGDVGGLRIRVMSYAAGVEVASRVAGPNPTPWLYGDRLRMGGVKLLADGALGSRGALLKADYADAPGQRGLRILNDAQLKNLMSHAAMNSMQVAVHAIGDGANREVLDAIEAMSDTYKGDRRWRIEHAQVVDPADLPRFARFGTIASMQPVHQTSDAKMAEARLGPARLAGAYAWATMERNKVRVAFTRQDANGQPFGGWQPQERISRELAWKAYTVDAAYAGFAEDKFGRLAPGLAADFIVIDKTDPLLLSPTELRQTKVLQTWIGGEKVYERSGAASAPAGR
jgi:predicted amidohydrolase YtcJ